MVLYSGVRFLIDLPSLCLLFKGKLLISIRGTFRGKNFADQSRVSLICDPAREVYAYYGIGQLAFFDLWGTRMWNALFKLKSQGIVNTV